MFSGMWLFQFFKCFVSAVSMVSLLTVLNLFFAKPKSSWPSFGPITKTNPTEKHPQRRQSRTPVQHRPLMAGLSPPQVLKTTRLLTFDLLLFFGGCFWMFFFKKKIV